VEHGCSALVEVDEFLLAALLVEHESKLSVEVRALSYDTGERTFSIPMGERSWRGEELFRSGQFLGAQAGAEKFIVRGGPSYEAPEITKLFSTDGRVVLELAEHVHEYCWSAPDRITTSGNRSLSSWQLPNKLLWKTDVWKQEDAEDEDDEVMMDSGSDFQRELLLLEGGDLIACEYHPIAASNDVIKRLDGSTGKPKWTTTCETPPVSHSKYRHEVYLELIDGKLVMCSQQSGAVFVEVLDPATGKQLHRWVLTDKLGE
jgi:hypothetical protein